MLSFSETWLDSSKSDSEIEIENYTVVRKDRNRKGGGVCVYIRADIGFNVGPELDLADVEAVWLDILLPKFKPILVGARYRPPDQTNFYELLEVTFAKSVDIVNSEVIIIGDLNTDILKKDSSICKALRSATYLIYTS